MITEQVVCGVERMDKLLDGTREEFEHWIRDTSMSDFRWCVHPTDTTETREMVASLVLEDIKRSERVFSEKNAFIERI